MSHVSSKLFIYESREIWILTLLTGVALFTTFTLGVHWGKKTAHDSQARLQHSKPLHGVTGTEDREWTPIERGELEKMTPEQMDEVVADDLKEEVERSGLKLDEVRSVELPREVKSKPKKLH